MTRIKEVVITAVLIRFRKPPLTPIYLISTISANPATTLLDSPRGSIRRVSGFVQTRSSSLGREVGISYSWEPTQSMVRLTPPRMTGPFGVA